MFLTGVNFTSAFRVARAIMPSFMLCWAKPRAFHILVNSSIYPRSKKHDLVEDCPRLVTAVLIKTVTASERGGGFEQRDLAMVFKRFISA